MIEGILSKDIEVWWPHVQEYLIPALEHGLGEYSIGDIKKDCKSKNMQLWVKMNGKVEGAIITKISKYPQKNILCVLLLGGNDFSRWRDEADGILTAFGKQNKCEYIELFGRKGWGKVLKDLNYEEQTRLFAKEIT